jgi:DNA ligase-1
MLAKEYEEKRITYPVMMQPKLDGVRCLVHILENGSFQARSRNNNLLTLPDQIMESLEKIIKYYQASADTDLAGVVLDGEIYMHGLSFQEIASRLKRLSTRHPDADILQYWVYDLYLPQEIGRKPCNFVNRHILVEKILTCPLDAGAGVYMCPTKGIRSPKELKDYHVECVNGGFEGSMIRDPNSTYASGKRSWSLMKYKDWCEDDFKITQITEGEGKNEGTAIIWCEVTPGGEQFKATAPGDYTSKATWWQSRHSFLGKMLSVKYQNLTDGGIPRFPLALGIKEDR